MVKNRNQNSKSEFTSVLNLLLGFFRWGFLSQRKPHLKGDTLIEVMFAVGVFGLAAIGTVSLMNRGLATTQGTLETSMARQEIDAQAEALRFIHSAYLNETNPPEAEEAPDCSNISSYRELWRCIIAQAYDHGNGPNGIENADPDFYTRTVEFGSSCDSLYQVGSSSSFGIPSKSFVINPRALGSEENLKRSLVTATTADFFRTTGTYPRLIYGTLAPDDEALSDVSELNNGLIQKDFSRLANAEGIWVTAVKSESGVRCVDDPSGYIRPDFYDFHIQTCWDSIAVDSAATVGSTVRLFNPDQITLTSSSASSVRRGCFSTPSDPSTPSTPL